MIRTIIRTAAGLALGVLLCFNGTAPAHAAAVHRCYAQGLHVTLVARGATAGTGYYRLKLHNATQAPCTMYGFPGVSFTGLSPAGPSLGRPAARDYSLPSRLVTVAPGSFAWAWLEISPAGDYVPPLCRAQRSSWLRAYGPGNFDANLRHRRLDICTGPVTQLAVTAVQPAP
jgi:hypothetical protein